MEYPPPPTKIHDFIGGGTSFIATFLPPDRVLKWTHRDVPHHAKHEREILELLGPHPRIIRYFGMWKGKDTSVVLEYHQRGCLRQVLRGFEPNRSDADTDIPRRRWAAQIAEGLAYIHSKGIVHGDVNASNVLVTNDGDVVMCDFVGSSLDGEEAVAPCYEPHHFRPREPHEDHVRFVQDDLFALGSLLYELYTHEQPYARQSDREVKKLYREGIFPDVSQLPVGSIITKCWTGGYKGADEILRDLGGLLNCPLALNRLANTQWQHQAHQSVEFAQQDRQGTSLEMCADKALQTTSDLALAELVMRPLYLPKAKPPFLSGFPVCLAFMTV